MKSRILTGLTVVLAASCVCLRADDTPAQAAARAALEWEFYQLNHASAQTSQSNAMAANPAPAEPAVSTTGRPGTDVSTVQTTPTTARKISAAPSETAPGATVPAGNTAVQAVAFAALKEKMEKLNNAASEPSSDKKVTPATVAIPAVPPALGASAAATPITETPAAEAPAARTPATAAAAVTPVSVPPAVMAPGPDVPSAPAAVAAPAVNIVSDAAPRSIVQRTTAPVIAPPATIGLPKSSPGHARPTNELVTVSGKIYKNVEVERVMPDGIFISYTPAFGGWATTKVPFEDLPASIRQLYDKH